MSTTLNADIASNLYNYALAMQGNPVSAFLAVTLVQRLNASRSAERLIALLDLEEYEMWKLNLRPTDAILTTEELTQSGLNMAQCLKMWAGTHDIILQAGVAPTMNIPGKIPPVTGTAAILAEALKSIIKEMESRTTAQKSCLVYARQALREAGFPSDATQTYGLYNTITENVEAIRSLASQEVFVLNQTLRRNGEPQRWVATSCLQDEEKESE